MSSPSPPPPPASSNDPPKSPEANAVDLKMKDDEELPTDITLEEPTQEPVFKVPFGVGSSQAKHSLKSHQSKKQPEQMEVDSEAEGEKIPNVDSKTTEQQMEVDSETTAEVKKEAAEVDAENKKQRKEADMKDQEEAVKVTEVKSEPKDITDEPMEQEKEEDQAQKAVEVKIEPKDVDDNSTDEKMGEASEGGKAKETEIKQESSSENKSSQQSPVAIVDPVLIRLKKEVDAAIKVYQKYINDMDLVNKVSQSHLSNYTRQVLIRKMNATTVHIDGYYVRIEMARTTEDFTKLLNEIRAQNQRIRQSQELNNLLGPVFM